MSENACVMIIDDDRTHLDMAQVIIGDDYAVTPVLSGTEAVAMMRGGAAPDLILLDIDMPGLDGYATYDCIRRLDGLDDTPIIFLTGLKNSEAELSGLALGAQDYITKPFVKQNLLARIRLRLDEARRVRRMQDDLRDAVIFDERFSALTAELTPAERDVARLIAQGSGNQEIAVRLQYTVGYVKNLSSRIYDKLGMHGRQALRVAIINHQ